MKDSKVKNIKREHLFRFTNVLLLLVAFNIISIFVFTRFDLTSEKKYTLSKSTKDMLTHLDDVIYIKIYLAGNGLPPDYAELATKTREFLDELRAYSKQIEYEFIDPAKGRQAQEMNAIYGELYRKGLTPQAIQSMEAEGVNTRYVVPGAIISYRQREVPVDLLDSDDGLLYNRESIIKYSIEKLEYNIGNAVRRITNQQYAKVAFLKGHGELTNIEVLKAAVAIANFYVVDSVILNNKISSIFDLEITDSVSGDSKIKNNKYDLLIIAKPTIPFGNYEKYLLDQFVMRGGRLLWYVDPVVAEMDSLYNHMEMPCFGRDLNLEDMFFRYGIRMNTNLLQDLNALQIPINSSNVGGQAQYRHIPWYYFPIITPFADHPIVKNLNVLRTEFISSIDTIGTNKDLKKTVLLTTSATTKIMNTPAIISLQTLKRRANMREFNKQYLPVSVLVEGEFNSLFSDLEGNDITQLGVISKSKATKMIFVSDGDMIKNQLGQNNFAYPLGFDRYTGMVFGNKNFLLNAVNYLCDDKDILQVRSKDFKMRLLDKNKILKEKSLWQTFNLALPLITIIILSIIFVSIRKFKYAK
ncbi:MAG: gliding motility-associated ABC transporter substrate-binding protein GldG [Bacteroidales bacterium]|jgi:ABC-2 type transport system permease protein|nr:gliding motility-associated ABC transporter substrate-binding protein GldG [Bacteroidales bacterium]